MCRPALTRIQFVLIFSTIFFVFGMGTFGCSWKRDSRPSILIIAVESLGFQSVGCGSTRFFEKDMMGFQIFCEDSVRFTHAFTPSLMSQAGLASLVTGVFPAEHAVHHNGDQFLSAKFETVAEKALHKGYRTAFFSGGAPIWHKSGLAQGFEYFEDNISVDLQRLYRPVRENFEMFTNWLDDEVQGQSFFSIIYLNDLLYPDVTTRNDLGEIRERSFDSQLRETGESLSFLIDELQKRKIWDSSYVFLVGLNGQTERDRPGEMDAFSMYSTSTQVGLFIKPARKPRDKGIEWSQDRNVSLVDVGTTLYDLIGEESAASIFSVTSLRRALERPEAPWAEERILWIESSWPLWRNVGGQRLAARMSNYLAIFDRPVKLFNTLIDRFEVIPVPPQDPVWRNIVPPLLEEVGELRRKEWERLPDSLVEKLRLANSMWRYNGFTPENLSQLRFLAKVRPGDTQMEGWQAYAAIDTRDWEWLDQLGQKYQRPTWRYLARRQMKKYVDFKGRGCDQLFLWKRGGFRTPAPSLCEDQLFIEGVQWILETDRGRADTLFESFWRNYRIAKTDEWIAKTNFVNSLIWDVPPDLLKEPLLIDQYLLLPRNQEYLKRLKRRLSSKDFRFQLSSPFEL